MTVLQWWLPVHLVQPCSPSDSTAAAITTQICHRRWQPAMNNLYEYSSIACAASPTVCLHSAAEPIVQAIPWPWNLWSDLSQLMTGWWELWRWQQIGNCRSIIAAAWDDRAADSADGVRVQPQDDFVAVLSASVALDCDDIWGQTAGIAFLSLPFLSAASGVKSLCDAKSYFFSALLPPPQLFISQNFPSRAHMFSPPCH